MKRFPYFVSYLTKSKIMSNHVTLEVKNASSMNAYIALPEGEGPFPGIIVFQEAFGVNTYIRRVTDRLARNGYVAIAPELFHRTAPVGFTAGYTEFANIQEHFQAIT